MNQNFPNARTAFMALMGDLFRNGTELNSRNGMVKELTNVCFTISMPFQRCILVKHRNDSIFHKVAETLWVMAGRNDVEWLESYLPRAKEWSDDGITWRGGYGPRLRNYCGADWCVDQVLECMDLLNKDPTSRRAVMSLFDPSRDFADTFDVPCNNLINWLIRDGRLNMSITQRSSDIYYGFSGINTFEWSVLHQMMAHWTNTQMGSLTYFINSLHLYERHWEVGKLIAEQLPTSQWYPYLINLKFNTSFDTLNETLNKVFDIEHLFRKGIYSTLSVDDPLLDSFLQVLKIFWMLKNGVASFDVVQEATKNSVYTDIDIAVLEYLLRKDVTQVYVKQSIKSTIVESTLKYMMGTA